MATGGLIETKEGESRNQLSLSNSTEDLLSDPNAAYPALRKHSSGDLHSRLKTRKLLGVGETDDGDVHRSKLSQILGHSEQLYIKLPRGLRVWQFLTAFMFSAMGVWALMFPTHLFNFALSGDTADKQVVLPIRLYGAALISLSVVFWCTLRTNDKDVIRWSLLASGLYFCIQILVNFIYSFSLTTSTLSWLGAGIFMCKLAHMLGSAYFHWCLGKHEGRAKAQ